MKIPTPTKAVKSYQIMKPTLTQMTDYLETEIVTEYDNSII